MSSQRQAGEDVDDDVVEYAQPLEQYAISHWKMYAFGMYFRVCNVEGGFDTRDSCLVASFTWQVPWGLQNERPVETTKEYVGYIEEILEHKRPACHVKYDEHMDDNTFRAFFFH